MARLRETLRIAFILLRYKWTALMSQLRSGRKTSAKREGTAPKRRFSAPVVILIFGLMAVSLYFNAFTKLASMTEAAHLKLQLEEFGLGSDCLSDACLATKGALLQPSPVWDRLPGLYWLGMVYYLIVVSFCSSFFPLMKVNHQTQDNSLDWIATFPVRLRSYFAGRIIADAFLQFPFWFFVLPTVLALTIMSAQNLWLAIPLAYMLAFSLNIIMSSISLLVDMSVKIKLSPKRQRDVRALVTVVLNPIFLIAYMGFISEIPLVWKAIIRFHEPLTHNVVYEGMTQLFRLDHPVWSAYLALFVLVFVLVRLTIQILDRMLARGLYSHSGYESLHATSGAGRSAFAFDWLPTMVWRELSLLTRDRSYAAQALGLPVILIGVQYLLHGSRSGGGPASNFTFTWILGTPLYFLMISSLQLVSREHAGLWQLTTFPRRFTDLLADRQKLWLTLAYVFYCGSTLMLLDGSSLFSGITLYRLLLGIVAIWMMENLCRTLSLFFHNPFSSESGKRVSPVLNIISMTLAGIMIGSIGYGSPWIALVGTIQMLGLTLAFRQKAGEYEPFIMDPSASPPAQASLSDGLIATLVYFVAQTLIYLVGVRFEWFDVKSGLMWASGVAALTCFLTFRLYYFVKKAQGIPRYLGSLRVSDYALVIPFLGGLLLLAWYWMHHAENWPVWVWLEPSLKKVTDSANFAPSVGLVIFAGFIAPFIEEFIFRGLIFNGLRRLLGLWPAVGLSSLIFALLHPPMAIGPVFLLGASASLLFHRSRILLPGVLLHVLYNLGVLWLASHS